ncbi:hypothetical protein HPB52_004425 [Rhipicephalus sanguineus]|uniref:Peptidase M13 N-terminal domain-containing protein n=1 Tax=Rhipicephalus sanguineus TaxID=34632 RepID=A0A9D4PR74_RHISA|nr:hypothetical protein HPB52_004425 [Rhipicephalus sanguineus]
MTSTHLRQDEQEDISKVAERIAVAKQVSEVSIVGSFKGRSNQALEDLGIPAKKRDKLRQESFPTNGHFTSRPTMSSVAVKSAKRHLASSLRSFNPSCGIKSVDLSDERTELFAEGVAGGEAEKYSTQEDSESYNQATQRSNREVESNVERTEDARVPSLNNETGARQESAIDIAVGTLLLVLVLVFVGLLYALFTRQKNAVVVSCTGECLNAQRYLEKLINVKHNACGDFYERVCSSWSYTDDSGFISDMVKETEERLNSSLLEVSSNTASSEQVIRARTIYRSCYTYATSDVHQESALLTADKILKFSSLRKSENWNELLQSLIRVAFEVGAFTVFTMDFVGDKGRPVLHIAAGRSIKQKRFAAASSKKFEDILRQLLSVPIERVMVIDQHVDNALKVSDFDEKRGSLESFVSGAIRGLSAVDWIIAVNKVVPKFSRIRLIDTVVTIGIDQVRAALNVLTEAGIKDAIEYHVASMAAKAVLFDVFQGDSESSAEKAASFCLHVTKTILRYSWPQVATAVLATTSKHQILRDIFSLVKEALSNSQVLYWTSDSAYTKAAKEVDQTLLLMSHGQSHRQKAARNLAHASEVSGDSRISTPIATLFEAMKDQRAFSMAHPPSTQDVLLWKKESTESVSYIPSASAIVVPTLYQMPHLLYSEHVPIYFNYGTAGAVLAHQTVAAFALVASYTTPDGHRDYWWSGMNPDRYNGTIGCLHQLYAELGFGLTISDEQTDAMEKTKDPFTERDVPPGCT